MRLSTLGFLKFSCLHTSWRTHRHTHTASRRPPESSGPFLRPLESELLSVSAFLHDPEEQSTILKSHQWTWWRDTMKSSFFNIVTFYLISQRIVHLSDIHRLRFMCNLVQMWIKIIFHKETVWICPCNGSSPQGCVSIFTSPPPRQTQWAWCCDDEIVLHIYRLHTDPIIVSRCQ